MIIYLFIANIVINYFKILIWFIINISNRILFIENYFLKIFKIVKFHFLLKI